MVNRERLYEAFGELVYVVAMADGLIQPAETAALENILKDHEWAGDIIWSFDYEVDKVNDVKDIYKKALNTLIENGPDPEYKLLFELLEEISHVSDGIDSDEAEIMIDLDMDLRQQFLDDIERHQLNP